MPVALAIDVGFANLGWAAINIGRTPDGDAVLECGVVRTVKSKKKLGVFVAVDSCRRCAELAAALVGLLNTWASAVSVAEVPHGGAKSAIAIRAMALGTGVVVAVLAVRGVPAVWTTPRDGKLAAGGSPGASKTQVETGAIRALPGAGPGLDGLKRADREHAADAMAAWLAARGDALIGVLRAQGVVA